MPSVAVIMPAKDESSRISQSVEAALSIPLVELVLVVDDGSVDNTADLAQSAGAKLLQLAKNQGKGAALEAGIAQLYKIYNSNLPDVVVFLDADLGYSSKMAEPLIELVLSGKADMAIAGFPPSTSKAGFGKVKSLALQAYAKEDPSFKCSTPLSGQRAMTAACLEQLLPLAKGFGVEVAMTVLALRLGMKVVEIPTQMSHAATGNNLSGIMHRAKQYLDVRRAIASLKKRS